MSQLVLATATQSSAFSLQCCSLSQRGLLTGAIEWLSVTNCHLWRIGSGYPLQMHHSGIVFWEFRHACHTKHKSRMFHCNTPPLYCFDCPYEQQQVMQAGWCTPHVNRMACTQKLHPLINQSDRSVVSFPGLFSMLQLFTKAVILA